MPYEAAEAWTDGSRIDDWTAAMQIYARLGARRARQRTARRLRLAGVDSVPRGPSPATARHPQGLTAREQEIAALLANGVTDAEIAAALHLSVRTVEHHVAAVLRKTGAATRRQLRDPAR
jgi:DNA-binding NarL/FixJ family response regulator